MLTGKRRIIALITLHALVIQALAPAGSLFALTSGPTQPEFSSFEPVTTSNMVNPLTGAFTYNLPVLSIPGPDGSGYALSLSYHAGVSPEEEASWVGYGWTLNPGAITRMKRGFPDDYNGEQVRYWHRTIPNWTVSAGLKANVEAFSKQTVTGSGSIRYNNYRGFGYVTGVSASVKGLASLGLTVGSDGLGYTYDVNPAAILGKIGLEFKKDYSAGIIASALREAGNSAIRSIGRSGWRYAQYSVANETHSTSFNPYTGVSLNVTVEGHFPTAPLPTGPNSGVTGNFTIQEPADSGLHAVKAYGYMYSANAGEEDAMDYYVEKDMPYTRRDRFLAVPFSNADLFSISGEGIGGGFRLYNKRPGQFHPNKVHSATAIGNFEAQGRVGPLITGVGAGLGAGRQTLDVNSWLDPSSLYGFAGDDDGDEPYFFRMNNDLGGSVLVSDDDNASRASIDDDNSVWGLKRYNVGIGSNAFQMNHGKRSKRSTYIGYSTIGEILNAPSIGNGHYPNFQAYDESRAAAFNTYDPASSVGEFSIATPAGARYTYGLPVYSRKEKNLSYGLSKLNVLDVKDRYLAYAHATAPRAAVVVGEERDGLYPSTYLLTSITSSDYIDRTLNGPTVDDFGGYTSFHYQRTAGEQVDYSTLNYNPLTNNGGSSVVRRTIRRAADPTKWAEPNQVDDNSWYKWRVPYNGLLYQQNSLSDEKDDMGSMSMGEREIYYLSTIETKTHVAVFVTNGGIATHGRFFSGSGEHRRDGYEAVHDEYDITGDETATRAMGQSGQTPNQLRRLERIELWSKDADGNLKSLIQTTHFEYDYSLCKGLPNSYDNQSDPADGGKLTLKRVYFEYNGVVNAKINPYVFGYEYRRTGAGDYANLPSEVKTKYQSIIDFANQWDQSEQNPNYQHYHIGRWGGYQYNGQQRYQAMNSWEDQNPDMTQFDPAAWQLKWIRLPSGGEIHVQYEQNDYGYVQDRVAMAVVPMKDGDLVGNKYFLNLEGSLGIAPGSVEEDRMIAALHDRFITKGEKIFFRVLHSLDGEAASISNVDKGRLEHISGYAQVVGVGRQSNQVYVELATGSGYSSPSDVARVFTKAWRAGNLRNQGMPDEGDGKQRVKALINKAGGTFFDPSNWGTGDEIDWLNSYMRIPLGTPDNIIRAKKGGGIRVARLLMYDPGLESGNGHLFGSQYIYQQEDGTTSGVATNEPTEGREENALVGLLDRREDQSWLERVIAGSDREQSEGPIGESLLPAPAVMYSRVVVRNIHSGKTNSGFSIYEYHTARDYPFQCVSRPEDVGANVTEMDRRSDFVIVPTPYASYNKANIWATQGYRFILSDLPGQIKRVATYGGNYDDPSNTWAKSSEQAFEYFTPGEKVPMLYDYSTQPTYRGEDPGKEMEMTFEGRSIEDITIDASGSIDASMVYPPAYALIAPMPVISMTGSVAYSESKLKTHVTCKVVRYPAIVKSVTSSQDDIESITENIGFNPLTGQPCVTRITDGYSGVSMQYANGVLNGSTTTGQPHNRSYKAFSYPAALEYSAMGQKADNERATVVTDATVVSIDKRYLAGDHYLSFRYAEAGKACNLSDLLSPGDLIDVFTTATGKYDPLRSIGVFHISAVSGNRVMILPHSGTDPIQQMDNVSIRVIRSGKTNQLSIPRAGITVYSAD